MTGSTLTMTVSPTVESDPSRRQPLPSPTPTPSLSSRHSFGEDPPSTTHTRALSSSHTPAWSDKHLPDPSAYAVPAIDFDFDVDVPLDFSTTLTLSLDPHPEDTNANSTAALTVPSSGGLQSEAENMGKRRTMMLSRPQSWMPSSRSAPDLGAVAQAAIEEGMDGQVRSVSLLPNTTTHDRSRSVSNSLGSFVRRPWISPSRSPSPTRRDKIIVDITDDFGDHEHVPSNTSIMKLKKGSRTRSGSSSSESSRSSENLSRLGSFMSKIKARPQTARLRDTAPNELDSSASSIISLAPPSTETRKSHASETSNSTFHDDIPPGRNSSAPRDPLWSMFKTLEADFQRFQSKPTAMKVNIIRASLVPFLRRLGSHPLNFDLHHEDLERRAIILNKWWTGVLDMLHMKSNPPVPGVDRPILLDALSTIMMRPEWRQSTPTFRPFAERNPRDRARRVSQSASHESSESTSSFHSTDSDYFVESMGHNVRNMFVTNLVSQMAFVTDKLSLRHAPNSLINFAGKACAYAFFFAPGVADILVRLWSLRPHVLRRVANELKLPRKSKGEGDDIVALFPPGLGNLGWTSATLMAEALRKATQPPLASNKISWAGPWVARWNGRDSDLFFVFCKYYFILAEGFMPPLLPLVERARAPAFVLVNAQMLSILDSTIHRQTATEVAPVAPLSDALHGANASVMALQMAPNNNNIMKGMSENRLVVLLKNMLSDSTPSFGTAHYTFAESFLAVMKAAVKHTSQFDHTSCFLICDFLDESLVAYGSFLDASHTQIIRVDWPFWLEVWKKMLATNNSMSEIRLLSLLYSTWDTIASDQDRKEAICVDWLLTEETFDKFFNNWCPMVRAFYMRLLCWRVCRDAGSANESDARIFLLVYTRLKKTWSHYLWLKQHAERNGIFPPSTAPSFPTPGKRFMIVRTEIPTLQPGFRVGFDSSITSSGQDMADVPATDFDSISHPNHESPSTSRKSWTLFGKVFSFSSHVENTGDLEALRRETAASRASATRSSQILAKAPGSAGSDSDSIESSPTYEATRYLFKFILSWNNAGTMPPPNRILTRPRLPSPAQSWVAAKGHGGPLPQAGPPPPTRAVSGSPFTGLVDSARNAIMSDVPNSPSTISTSMNSRIRGSIGELSFTDLHDDDMPLLSAANLSKENLVSPVEPTGLFTQSVKYSGRALAEWSLVVAECNSFVERRREEGVLGLPDVEVPTLGVEGFRKIC